ncbi:hypothetical protein CI610_02537 [invertebrate metagenome]|uniref:Uncharacterized protein n=1 Tax=invertebrate metagenome TaxID=1711999 RepID=A0A2H9T5M7_9ZZZZ
MASYEEAMESINERLEGLRQQSASRDRTPSLEARTPRTTYSSLPRTLNLPRDSGFESRRTTSIDPGLGFGSDDDGDRGISNQIDEEIEQLKAQLNKLDV